jgi:hypothetical protein
MAQVQDGTFSYGDLTHIDLQSAWDSLYQGIGDVYYRYHL